MEIINAFIHLFKTPGGYYVYDVNTNVIFRVDKDIYNQLMNPIEIISDADHQEYVEKMIGNLKEQGFLSEKRFSNIVHSADETLEYYLARKVEMATLQITRNCNLRCAYCAFSGKYYNRVHESRKMSFETARKGIDFLINHSGDCASVNLGFYGGEPLLEFDLMQKCIEYAEETAEGKELTFSTTTNGTLLKEEIVEYFIAHRLNLTISLDGPKSAHDKNRKFAINGHGSFDYIMGNLEKIKSKYPQYMKKVLINVVMDTENDFGCMSDFFTNYDTIKESNFRSTFITDEYSKHSSNFQEEFVAQRNYEIFKMYLAKINRLDEKSISRVVMGEYIDLKQKMHDNWKRATVGGTKGHPGGPCIPGIQRLFIDVDGNLLPCERVSETSSVMKIGHLDSGFDIEHIRKLLNIGKLTEVECRKCWAFRHCQLCAAAADNLSELSAEKKLTHCARVRRFTEEKFKDYCVLKEFKHDFEEYQVYAQQG